MTHIPEPIFIPNDEVTIQDPRIGTLRLVVRTTEPSTNGGPNWITMTDKNGYGHWRMPAHAIQRGWGN